MATDFYKFYISAEQVLAGNSAYWQYPSNRGPYSDCLASHAGEQAADAGIHVGERLCLHPNLNPPFFVALMLPLVGLGFTGAWWVWSLLSMGAGVLAVHYLVRELDVKRKCLATLAGIALLFSYYPATVNLEIGQVGLFIMLLLVLAWRYLRSGREVLAGFWLGVGAGLKPFLGLFLIALIVDRRWQAVVGFIAGGVVTFVVGLLALGLPNQIEYIRMLGSVDWYAINWNASISGLVHRLLSGNELPGLFAMPQLSPIVVNVVSGLILAITIFILCKVHSWHESALRLRSDFLFAVTSVAMLLLSPLGWMYYFPVLAIVLAVCWIHGGRMSLRNAVTMGGFVFVIVTIFPSALVRSDKFVTGLDWWWTGALYSYALIVLFLAVVFLMVRSQPVSDNSTCGACVRQVT
ncbi:MAG: glycosyltransferase family 87 protein [Porticoccaceae bacterium]